MTLELRYLLVFIALLVTELLYFRIADRYHIIDKPNERSSHSGTVIRGSGMIFFAALLFAFVLFDLPYHAFMLGAAGVAFISFLDDIRPRKSVVRFVVQLVAVALMFHSAGIFAWEVWLVSVALIVCVGTLNAFNFMDGINGITGVYALVNLLTCLYVQVYVQAFAPKALIVTVIFSVLIFLFFNFRKTAKCFAGDVGSVTLAYIQIFLLLLLIVHTHNFYWVIMFLVFGVDSVVTILYRLARKENIFRAHRTHLYQYLTNERKLPHRFVAALYGLVQLSLNALLVYFVTQNVVVWMLVISVAFLTIYVIVRIQVLKMIRSTRA